MMGVPPVLFFSSSTFQLGIGMTRIHSTLRVFSKIGLVMLLYLLVLVRNSIGNLCLSFEKKIYIQEPVPVLDASMFAFI